MFATKLDLFSIITIIIPTHIKLVFKLVDILDFSIAELVPKQHVELICILTVDLTIPPDIVKQHLLQCSMDEDLRFMIRSCSDHTVLS
jgi:hypothetical protein